MKDKDFSHLDMSKERQIQTKKVSEHVKDVEDWKDALCSAMGGIGLALWGAGLSISWAFLIRKYNETDPTLWCLLTLLTTLATAGWLLLVKRK